MGVRDPCKPLSRTTPVATDLHYQKIQHPTDQVVNRLQDNVRQTISQVATVMGAVAAQANVDAAMPRVELAGDLRAVTVTGFVDTEAHLAEVTSLGSFFYFDPTSLLPDDGLTVIRPLDGNGAWLLSSDFAPSGSGQRVATIALMAALSTASFATSESHIVEVLSIRDLFRLDPTTTIADWSSATAYAQGALVTFGGVTFVAIQPGTNHATSLIAFWVPSMTRVAAVDGGGVWTRLLLPNHNVADRAFWAYDPSNVSGLASDENQGWGTSIANAELAPLLTSAELNRRLNGYKGYQVVICSLMSSDPTTVILSNVTSITGNDVFCVQGKKVQLGADYTCTAYATAVPSANTGYLVSATGLGAAGNVGCLLSNAALTKFAFIQASKGADQVRTLVPNSYDAPTFAGSFVGVSFTVGETLRVWNLPTLNQYPFGSIPALYAQVQDCEVMGYFSDGIGANDFTYTSVGSASPTLSRCIINGVLWQGGVQGVMTGCQFARHTTNLAGAKSWGLNGCGIRGTQLLCCNSTLLQSYNLDIEAGYIFLSDLSWYAFNDPTANMSMFNCTHTAFDTNALSVFEAYSAANTLYGSGNSTLIFNLGKGTSSVLPAVAASTVTTSFSNPLALDGVLYNFSDLPVSDLFAMASLLVP